MGAFIRRNFLYGYIITHFIPESNKKDEKISKFFKLSKKFPENQASLEKKLLGIIDFGKKICYNEDEIVQSEEILWRQ